MWYSHQTSQFPWDGYSRQHCNVLGEIIRPHYDVGTWTGAQGNQRAVEDVTACDAMDDSEDMISLGDSEEPFTFDVYMSIPSSSPHSPQPSGSSFPDTPHHLYGDPAPPSEQLLAFNGIRTPRESRHRDTKIIGSTLSINSGIR